MSVLDRLVNDPELLTKCWENTPLVSTGLGDFSDVFAASTIEDLLHGGLVAASSVRLFRDGAQLPGGDLVRRRERGAADAQRFVDGDKVEQRIRAGATLVLEEIQTYAPPVAAFAAALTAETGCQTYCAAFVTPAGSRGVAPHYDTASVFVRQVYGTKRWRVSEPVTRWPIQEWHSTSDVDTDLVVDVELAAGDCLYIPRGHIHVGDATDDASIHLSIGLHPVTWRSLLRTLVNDALSDESLRESLPYAFHRIDPAALHHMLDAKAETLIRRLATRDRAATDTTAIARLRPPAAPPVPPEGSLLASLHAARET